MRRRGKKFGTFPARSARCKNGRVGGREQGLELCDNRGQTRQQSLLSTPIFVLIRSPLPRNGEAAHLRPTSHISAPSPASMGCSGTQSPAVLRGVKKARREAVRWHTLGDPKLRPHKDPHGVLGWLEQSGKRWGSPLPSPTPPLPPGDNTEWNSSFTG